MEIDYDVSAFIITVDNKYILPEEYDKEQDGNGIFVCLTNDRLNPDYGFNNSICIYRDWRKELLKTKKEFFENIIDACIYKGYMVSIWQNDEKEIPNNERYNFNKKDYKAPDKDEYLIECLDGYLGCKSIMSNVTPLLKDDTGKQTSTIEGYIPAIMLTHHTKVYFNGQRYNGYLPAIGQLMFLSANISKMNSALKAINEQTVIFEKNGNQLSGNWWSSTQYNEFLSWRLYSETAYLCAYNNKDAFMHVLPLFAV